MIRLLLLLSLWSASCLSELVKLTDEDFEKQFASKDWLIKFYAPWCKHCVTLKPIFEELAAKVSHVGIAEVDATESKLAAKKYNVTSFPTILYKQDGTVGKFDGARTLQGLSFFLERMNAPAYLDISVLSDIGYHSAFSDNVTFVLAYNAQKTEVAFSQQIESLSSSFKTVAKALKQHTSFAIMPTSDGFYLTKYGDISISKFEPGKISVNLDNILSTTVDSLTAFVEANNYPLVSHFDNHNFKRLSGLGKYIVAAVVDYSDVAESSAILSALAQAVSPATPAAEDQTKLIFGHLDGVKWRTFIKHHRTMLPAVLLLDQANDLHQTFPLPPLSSASSSTEGYSATLQAEVASIVLSIVHGLDDKAQWRASEPPGMFEKMQYRFNSYYPWSIAVIFLPVTFLMMALFAPYPKEKKMKKH